MIDVSGPIPWFMVTEMFAQGPRSAAVIVSVVINWLSNFAVGLVFHILQKSLETFLVLSCLSLSWCCCSLPSPICLSQRPKAKVFLRLPSCLNLPLWIDQNPEIPTKAQRTDTAPKS
ncbi:solute carrier family 2 facilitated glucose transporter member 2 [Biomphalaria pfeifferi]|uniref:Solute carrier family 2 facilitated glucose transporter member 2 n=1 Tax=Biomphalaria pfeifferi TaxID=112525 RepID=A0AAD8C5R9_BIOPF|nr:solute carrier family 2 facilitated glucose transporter member 2 [Biomphalaria pfeifferi]